MNSSEHSGVDLVSVNTGPVAVLGKRQGETVLSGIRKHPVTPGVIQVGEVNLAGDAQGDLRVHGGVDKAVYAYPVERIAQWNALLNPAVPFAPGTFGENLTVSGWLEEDVYIGDIWQWGSAMLQVSQPRFPCYKLGMATGYPGIVNPFVEFGWTGWYLRVLVQGEAPVSGPIQLHERSTNAVSVYEAHCARLPSADQALGSRVAAAPGLAAGLRQDLLDRLAEPR